MIDEMMTLLETEQVGEDNKKAYYVKSFVERDDEAKAPTREITGHKDLFSSRDAHIQAMRKSILKLDEQTDRCSRQSSWQPSVASVGDIKESLQEMKSGRHVRAKPRASRLMVPARRLFGFTRECETSASRKVRDDATLLETPTKRWKLCCRTS